VSFGETIVRLRAPLAAGGRGEQVRAWGSATRSHIRNALIAPGPRSVVDGEGRHGVSTDLTVYLPAGAGVLPTDRLEIRGSIYEVAGEVADWRQPWSTTRFGIAVGVNRVKG
jgi:hypothetical protein